jgi:hypothetical protein
LSEELHRISFANIVVKYLEYEPYLCRDEDEARILVKTMQEEGKDICFFTSNKKGFSENLDIIKDKIILNETI